MSHATILRQPAPLGMVLFLLLSSPASYAAGPTGLLNDTGQQYCQDGNSKVFCDSGNSGYAAAYPGQDGRYGRDAANVAITLTKVGAGAVGFDFTRVCMSGELAGQGTCPANPAQGSNPNEWACTLDNVTNLVWSLDSTSYSWDAAQSYPAAMDGTGRCNFSSGWRLPTRRELLSIVHNGVSSPTIDSDYFPNTALNLYWSAEAVAASPAYAWFVAFTNGITGGWHKSNSGAVRLVHDGQ